jgi:catechol 2,3-dioxygenase-like lactoylglutathione lyase family enzyme
MGVSSSHNARLPSTPRVTAPYCPPWPADTGPATFAVPRRYVMPIQCLASTPGQDQEMDQRVSLITLGVADTARARHFYEALGWTGQSPDGDGVFFQARRLPSGRGCSARSGRGRWSDDRSARCHDLLGWLLRSLHRRRRPPLGGRSQLGLDDRTGRERSSSLTDRDGMDAVVMPTHHTEVGLRPNRLGHWCRRSLSHGPQDCQGPHCMCCGRAVGPDGVPTANRPRSDPGRISPYLPAPGPPWDRATSRRVERLARGGQGRTQRLPVRTKAL